mmetsp:Transcript_20230/g.63479  ORF Transcript_20230/g.63479 Transcript_20230/m.63479 type:complete len:239 (+) Transcript_20230:533-1249(+)
MDDTVRRGTVDQSLQHSRAVQPIAKGCVPHAVGLVKLGIARIEDTRRLSFVRPLENHPGLHLPLRLERKPLHRPHATRVRAQPLLEQPPVTDCRACSASRRTRDGSGLDAGGCAAFALSLNHRIRTGDSTRRRQDLRRDGMCEPRHVADRVLRELGISQVPEPRLAPQQQERLVEELGQAHHVEMMERRERSAAQSDLFLVGVGQVAQPVARELAREPIAGGHVLTERDCLRGSPVPV